MVRKIPHDRDERDSFGEAAVPAKGPCIASCIREERAVTVPIA